MSEETSVNRTLPTYEVFALRIGTHAQRTARENFLFDASCADPDALMPLDFYFWVIRGERSVIVVDTGFEAATAARRDRELTRHPIEALAAIGVDVSDVSDVIITHMHWDHVGNLDLFPYARVHLQEAELGFCTGPRMTHHVIRKTFEADDVATAIRHLFAGRLRLHRSVAEITPGVSVHPVGGHTPGIQVVRVPTSRGWIVLASDAAHLWANIRHRRPFPIVDDLARMLEAYVTIEALADGEDHVIPGHDPLVAKRFPRSTSDDQVFYLHEEPKALTAGEGSSCRS